MFVRMQLASGESVVINTTHIVMARRTRDGICEITLRSTITHGASVRIEVRKTLEEIESLPLWPAS